MRNLFRDTIVPHQKVSKSGIVQASLYKDKDCNFMTLTGKQIRQLRSMCNTLKATLIIGKSGVTPATASQVSGDLEARELVKCSVLDGCPMPVRDVAYELAEMVDATVVQVIGRKFTLYRESSREDIDKIQLV